MRDLRIPAALLFTASLFLTHCSSGEDTPSNGAGTGGTSAMAGSTMGGSAGTGKAGTGGGAGTTSMGGSMGGASGSSSGSGGAGAGGAAGTGGGMAGRGGAGAGGAGRGGAGAAGTAGSVAGMAGGGAGGQAGGAGMAGSGSGMGGNAGAGGASGFTLTSSVITEGGMFPDDNTCAGTNKSPPLTWTAGPSGTMSYAVVLFDTSNMLNHWAMWDIPSTVTMLPAALDSMAMSTAVPGAKQKSFQGNGYYGPCPSGMDHVYRFTVYALSTATLSGAMTSQMPNAIAMAIMDANPLGSASLSAHSDASM
ncbi:MAG TPA: YbhB/YbcL family Raf kinase inhibitor-like protein [Polyangiaceae bacterium]|nr:YbhB/YbcL family Raf kinase inhibitor-like protein [Polyangiaceae bacterium]